MPGANYVVALILEATDKNATQVLGTTGNEVERFADRSEQMGQRVQRAFAGAAIAMTFGRAVPVMQRSIALYSEADAAITSLGSAVRYAGEDFDAAKRFLDEYVEDGLMPLSQATVGLKNLLLAGYGLEKSKEMLRALKDFAAFGRQGQLSMGEAVLRATEGLKNQMSQLVDNAGLTKNLSVMYREYAQSVGKGAGSLSEAEKITAVYLGTMGEWEAVHGDAAKASEQLVGVLARHDASIRTLYETIGAGLEPALRQVLGALGPTVQGITDFANANPEATATLLGGAGLVAGVGALAAAFALIGSGGALVVAVLAGLSGLVTWLVKVQKAKERVGAATVQVVEAHKREAEKVRALAKEYEELTKKAEPTFGEKERIHEITEDLVDIVPTLSGLLKDEATAHGDVAAAARDHASALDELAARGEKELRRELAVTKNRKAVIEMLIATTEATLEANRAFWESQPPGANQTAQYVTILEELNAQLEQEEARYWDIASALAHLMGLPTELPLGLDAETFRSGAEVIAQGAGDVAEKVKEVWGVMRISTPEIDAFFDVWGKGVPTNWEDLLDFFREWYDWLFYTSSETKKGTAELTSFEKKLGQATEGWGDFEDYGVGAITSFTASFGDALFIISQAHGDTVERLKELWQSFFEMLWREIFRLAAQKAALSILSFFMPALFAEEGGKLKRAAGGGTLVGPSAGFDRVPVLAGIEETILTVDLTRRLERFLADVETVRAATLARDIQRDSELIAGDTYHITIETPDAATFRTMLRSGSLGREIEVARRHGRLPRY
jgi:hypothetical protein